GDEAPAIPPEVAERVGQRPRRGALPRPRRDALAPRHAARRTAAMKRRTLSASFRPGVASTPELTSTAYGLTTAIARATVSGVSPAARITCGSTGRAASI